MNFTEAMQKAFENPGMVFKKNDNLTMSVEGGLLVFKTPLGYKSSMQYVCTSDFNADWQPVPKEVTWQEAIQAWINGTHKVYFALNGFKYSLTYTHILGYEDENVSKAFTRDDFLKGKFYKVEG